MSPTQRSLEHLRGLGHLVQVVERWIPHARIRQDVFGFGDLLCASCSPFADHWIALVQTTSGSNVAARCKKIDEEPKAVCWLMAGGRIFVHGWAKKGPRGKRKLWTLRVLEALRNPVRHGEDNIVWHEIEA